MKKLLFSCFLFFISSNVYALEDVYLHVLGTSIDEKIVQAEDNTYYLSHNSLNNKDIKGATFLDYRNNINDKKLIIYGHNSDTLDTPFKNLENYLDYNFYNKHKYIFLSVSDKTYIYKIFSIMVNSNNEHTRLGFKNIRYIEHLKYLNNNSIYDSEVIPSSDDEILVLQTCNYNSSDSFLVVSARKVKGDIL